jgi:hypothetical protein
MQNFKNFYFLAGIFYGIFSVIVEFFLPSLQKLYFSVAGFLTIVAILLLFFEKYRSKSRKFLLGFFGFFLSIIIFGLFGTFIFSFLN